MDERIAMFNEDIKNSILIPGYVRKYKTLEDVPEKSIIWQPRLTKPKTQTNSMLFKVKPGTDIVRVIWMIPAREMWAQYEKGKLTESSIIAESIHDFEHDRKKLEASEPDDLTEEEVDSIYREISTAAKWKKAGYTLV
jgi:hypothetical protein